VLLYLLPTHQKSNEAGRRGGNTTAAFNAANEEAIASFIEGRLSFLSIFDVVEEMLAQWTSHQIHSISDVLEADREARGCAYQDSLFVQ